MSARPPGAGTSPMKQRAAIARPEIASCRVMKTERPADQVPGSLPVPNGKEFPLGIWTRRVGKAILDRRFGLRRHGAQARIDSPIRCWIAAAIAFVPPARRYGALA